MNNPNPQIPEELQEAQRTYLAIMAGPNSQKVIDSFVTAAEEQSNQLWALMANRAQGQGRPLTPEETERAWLTALEEQNNKLMAHVTTMANRAQGQGPPLTSKEIDDILNYLHGIGQHFSTFLPKANELAALNYPRLSQRLTALRQDLQKDIAVYSDMYRKAEIEGTKRWGIVQDVNTDTTNTIREVNTRQQSAFDKQNCIWNYVNQGVPYAEAVLLCQQCF